jgi:CHRD domain
MRRVHVIAAFALVGLAVAGLAFAGTNRNTSVHLNGDFEVPVRDTAAQGQAIFHVAKDGKSVDYKLIVANIDNAFAAHIHCGTPGQNGPVLVTLFSGPIGAGRMNGVIAKGTFTEPNPGNACALSDLADVIALLEGGGGYVNVQTNDGVDPPNTGPGDFPGGEIRGDT